MRKEGKKEGQKESREGGKEGKKAGRKAGREGGKKEGALTSLQILVSIKRNSPKYSRHIKAAASKVQSL